MGQERDHLQKVSANKHSHANVLISVQALYFAIRYDFQGHCIFHYRYYHPHGRRKRATNHKEKNPIHRIHRNIRPIVRHDGIRNLYLPEVFHRADRQYIYNAAKYVGCPHHR